MTTSKSIDIVVFGATGFTGLRVIARLIQVAVREKSSQGNNFRLAIGGRNEAKLKEVKDSLIKQVFLEELGFKTLSEEYLKRIQEIVLITADTSDLESLERMASTSTMLINCTGPFRFHGAPVVKACLSQNCHYLDVTGEPEFIEKSWFENWSKAKEQNVLIVHACGFDSVPLDIGILFLKEFIRKGDEIKNLSVECFLAIRVEGEKNRLVGHETTWQSAVHGFSTQHSYQAWKRSKLKEREDQIFGREPTRSDARTAVKKGPFWQPLLKSWALLFPGADSTVIRRSQKLLQLVDAKSNSAPPPAFKSISVYFVVEKIYNLVLVMVCYFIFSVLTLFEGGRQLLLQYPESFSFGTFSKQGPTAEQMKATSFTFTILCRDSDGKLKYRSSVSGPEPGYVATPNPVVEAAVTLLQDKIRKKNGQFGGVYTPAAALYGTSFIDRLVKFEILDLKASKIE